MVYTIIFRGEEEINPPPCDIPQVFHKLVVRRVKRVIDRAQVVPIGWEREVKTYIEWSTRYIPVTTSVVLVSVTPSAMTTAKPLSRT